MSSSFIQGTVPESAVVFDRRLVRRHRDRAAHQLAAHDFLFAEIGERLLDRLDDITHRFPLALDLGCRQGLLGRLLQGRGGIRTLLQCDLAGAVLGTARGHGPAVQADEEALPFKEESLDLVLSNLALHWVNDLPGALIQINRALRPDGLFLAAIFGGNTLIELRECLTEAELAETGGISPRISPFADLRDAAGLLQRGGFALPVADAETITVTYPDMMQLMADLRAMGEANAVLQRLKRPTRRAVFAHAAALYAARHGVGDGRIKATFQILFLTGWAPHDSQQKPLRRGSAKARLADAFGGSEKSAGEKAG
jgi:NADH dehydrogenase [ubiquinone] 1 alpha subcomplex assembly factor 5